MKLVVLDRDGVINMDSSKYIRTEEDWIPIPGSLEAIARLNHAGFRILVASNQSGLARGYFSIDNVNAIHRKMRRELALLGAQIDAIFFCPHGPEEGCHCRKPLPGLLEDIGVRLKVNLRRVHVIGDSFRDIQAAIAVGASPLLVLTGNGNTALERHRDELQGIPIYEDLATAAEALLCHCL